MRSRNRYILTVVACYALLAFAWIFFSDRLLALFADIDSIVWLSTAKGAFFVVASAIAFLVALRATPHDASAGQASLTDQLANAVNEGTRDIRLNYAIVIAISVATLALHQSIIPVLDGQPVIIMLMFPISIGALLGGIGPGFVALGICTVGTFFVLPADGQSRIANGNDFVRVGFLVLNGIVVILLSGILRRSLKQRDIDNRLLKAIVSGTPDAMYVKNLDGQYLLANDAVARFVGKPMESIIGHDDSELFPQRSAEELKAIDCSILIGGVPQTHEETLTMADGRLLTFLVTKGPIAERSGKAVGLFGISRDITQRKHDEERLRESEMRLREAQKLARIGHWSVDVATGNGTWSPEIFRILSVDPSLAPANMHEAQRFFAPSSWAKVEAAISRLQSDDIPVSLEAQLAKRDGEDGWVIMRGNAVRDEQGRAISIFGTMQDITERKRYELQLARSEADLHEAQRIASIGSWSHDARSGVISWSPELFRIFGRSPHLPPLTYAEARKHFAPSIRERADAAMNKALEKGGFAEVELEIIRPDQAHRWIIVRGHALLDAAGNLTRTYGTVQDITERRIADQQRRTLAQAVEQNPGSVIITDIEGVVEYANPAFERKTGFAASDVVGRHIRMLKSGKTPPATYESLWRTLSKGLTWEGEFINQGKDGREFVDHAIISPLRTQDGAITHYLAIQEDVTERKRSEERIHRLSYYDLLTGLPNRAMLMDAIGRTRNTATRNHRYSALMLVNIDRFKTINDAVGEALGDVLLRMVAERLTHNLREADIVARMTGDEFAILLTDQDSQLQSAANVAMHVAEKIHRSMQAQFIVEKDRIALTTSIGIALFPESSTESPLDILRRANTSLHHAKSGGGGQTAFFETRLDEVAKRVYTVERELHQALANDELRLFLQSQVDAAGQLVGAEALVRWQHPTRGLVPPGTFIPIAEQSNLIVDVGIWVLRRVCRLIAAEGTRIGAKRIAVNISPRHFRQPGFVEQVRNELVISGADPMRLTLEVTEGMLVDNFNDVVAKMNELSAMGIHFSLDDFGTGYSSLTYLKRLPIHEIKIDKTFVQDMTTDSNDASLVETILSIAHHLNLAVVAEGVETAEQAEFLNQRGRVIHQGYFFGKPEPEDNWLGHLRHLRAA